MLKKQITIEKLFNRTILFNITITDEEIKKYYDENIADFTVPEQVRVAHILIFIDDNVSESQALEKINNVKNSLNETNFCELVTKYSQDIGSLKSCGEYIFGRNEMVPEFENSSFNLKINETAIVKTIYGYHLIKKLEYFPAIIDTLEKSLIEIKSILRDEKAQENFDILIKELTAKATIINYLSGKNTTQIEAPIKTLDDFAKCLTTKNATFYGATWCSHCANQKEMFGNSFQYINYVECADANNPQIQTPECEEAKIAGYPTWIINEQQYPGEQTLANLAKLTGCEQ